MVTVKDVPDVQSDRGLGADRRLVRDGGDNSLNELDENAVQAAVDLAAQNSGEVVAISIGAAQALDAVRRALQLGANRGVLVSDDRLAGLDAIGTATALAAVIAAEGNVDLVLCGMASTDGLTATVPAAIAALLGIPALTLVEELSVDHGQVYGRRELEDLTEQISVPLPALVSVTDAVNEPEVPGFRAILGARKKPVARWDLDALAPGLSALGLDTAALGSRTRLVEAAPTPPRTDRVLVEDDGTAATTLATWLIDRHLV